MSYIQPVTDITATASLTAQNSNPLTGVATANSAVAISGLNGTSIIGVHVGTTAYTGTLVPQVSNDGTNWVSLAAGKQWMELDNGNFQDNIVAAAGAYQMQISGFGWFRLTFTSGMSGTAVINMRATTGAGATRILGNLPAGPNQIGNVGQGGTWSINQAGTWTIQPGNTANTTAWLFKQSAAATSAITSVAGSATSVTVLASNVNRRMAHFFNDSTAVLYLAFAATASITAYTVQIPAGGYYEMPTVVYSGLITGIWSAANGNVRVTEVS